MLQTLEKLVSCDPPLSGKKVRVMLSVTRESFPAIVSLLCVLRQWRLWNFVDVDTGYWSERHKVVPQTRLKFVCIHQCHLYILCWVARFCILENALYRKRVIPPATGVVLCSLLLPSTSFCRFDSDWVVPASCLQTNILKTVIYNLNIYTGESGFCPVL